MATRDPRSAPAGTATSRQPQPSDAPNEPSAGQEAADKAGAGVPESDDPDAGTALPDGWVPV